MQLTVWLATFKPGLTSHVIVPLFCDFLSYSNSSMSGELDIKPFLCTDPQIQW
jgi:hypothetical protein